MIHQAQLTLVTLATSPITASEAREIAAVYQRFADDIRKDAEAERRAKQKRSGARVKDMLAKVARLEAIAADLLAAVDRAATCGDACANFQSELTPAGEQLVIPGCERVPPKTDKPAQLSLWG